jgi:hypothetical protein
MSRKCLIRGSWSLNPLLYFSTYFWFEQGLVFSCEKSYTSTLISPINFLSERRILPVKTHKSVGAPLSRIYHLWEYFLSVFILHFMIWEVCCRKQFFLVILLKDDFDKTLWDALQSLERYFLPILCKSSTRFITIWWIVSKLLTILMCKILPTTVELIF